MGSEGVVKRVEGTFLNRSAHPEIPSRNEFKKRISSSFRREGFWLWGIIHGIFYRLGELAGLKKRIRIC